jgi:branched-subunit amino acid aminotransferase/4-amino-4-deoxychorismate lyase
MNANQHPQGAPIAWIADPEVDVVSLDVVTLDFVTLNVVNPNVDTADAHTHAIETVDVSGGNVSSNKLSGDNVSRSGASSEQVAAVGTGTDDLGSKSSAVQIVGQALTLERGRWGHPDQLTLPLSDRGLQLADGLFETLLVAAGQPLLLKQHLERWRSSAALLGMAEPPDARALEPRIAEAVQRSGIRQGALRLNWSRGSGGRGLDLPAAGEPQPIHRFWLQLVSWQPSFSPLTAIISRQERRHADSLLSRCKSFAYTAQIQARREARAAGADDALLLNGRDELCCGSAANLLVRRGGHWLTPADDSGCLPGVMRRRALESGLAQEARLSRDDLLSSDGALLINSLSCRPLLNCDGQDLAPVPEATELWRSLLNEDIAETTPP